MPVNLHLPPPKPHTGNPPSVGVTPVRPNVAGSEAKSVNTIDVSPKINVEVHEADTTEQYKAIEAALGSQAGMIQAMMAHEFQQEDQERHNLHEATTENKAIMGVLAAVGLFMFASRR